MAAHRPRPGSVDTMTSPDVAFGVFTDSGPWVVDPDELRWRRGLDEERVRLRGEVDRLLDPGRLPPAGRLATATAVLGPALAAWTATERHREDSRAALAHRLRVAFERLGPTYVKLGQIVSGGEGIFPSDIVDEFSLLRDQVPAVAFDRIRDVVERELYAPLENVFAEFDPEPIAAASIAQVHAARLATGEDVVVKVQRPGVAELVRADIRSMAWLAPRMVGRIPIATLANPPALVELFAETIIEELDFRLEAENMIDVAMMLATAEQRGLVVPRPHPSLVTRRVLVMERLHGFAFHDVDAMHAAGIATEPVLRAGLIGFMEGAMIHGIFHGDLHGGNLLVQRDGRAAVFDFGITARLDEPQRLAVLRTLVTGLAGDVKGQLAALRDLGAFPPDTDLDEVIRELDLEGPVKDPTQMSSDELILELRSIVKKLLAYGAGIPKELMLLLKNMIYLNAATASLAPDLDILAEIAAVYAHFTERHGARIMADIGVDTTQATLDLDAVKASFGLTSDVEGLTFRELQERRKVIIERMGEHRSR